MAHEPCSTATARTPAASRRCRWSRSAAVAGVVPPLSLESFRRCRWSRSAAVAGVVPPPSLESFRGRATALQNYVHGQIRLTLAAHSEEDIRFTDRTIHHVLTHRRPGALVAAGFPTTEPVSRRPNRSRSATTALLPGSTDRHHPG
ncbi:hypothetical protein L083_5030 [Actinoplanes sp. N902-109]|nr:hypothetical protein L083_5030 [Actinoplanes sp. N902-109]